MTFEHGASGYTNHRCRCRVCTDASVAEDKRKRAARHAATAANGGIAPGNRKHNRWTYGSWHCRCETCVADMEAHRHRNKERG